MCITNEKIRSFLSKLNLGLSWIHDAGKQLVEILNKDPDAYDDIIQEADEWVTKDILKTVEAIGRGQIAPELLILPIHVFNRLSSLPMEEQLKAIQGVPVAVDLRSREGYHVIDKPAAKLSKAESKRVIAPDGRIRTPVEQMQSLTPQTKIGTIIGKYQVVMEAGQEPRLSRIFNGELNDYHKQRVKLVHGCALVELYL